MTTSLRPVNDDELLGELDRLTYGWGNGARLAALLKVQPAHLRAMKSGAEPVSMKVAAGLGYQLHWVKVRKGVHEA
jgi:hypothetical protein